MAIQLDVDESISLQLGPNFSPDANNLVTYGWNILGEIGSGKTNTLVRIMEQIGNQYVPFVLFAVKRNLLGLAPSLPNSFICTPDNGVTAKEILEEGKQVIIDASRWSSLDAAILFFADLIDQLAICAKSLDIDDRVPCLIIVDEAQQILPQRINDVDISKETAQRIKLSWQVAAKQCREYGLITCTATQNISKIDKGCLVGQTYILMRQTSPNDLERYAEYVEYKTKRDMYARFRSLPTGKAIVIFPHEKQEYEVRFFRCESDLPSQTPRVQSALYKFGKKKMSARPALYIVEQTPKETEKEPIEDESIQTAMNQPTPLEMDASSIPGPIIEDIPMQVTTTTSMYEQEVARYPLLTHAQHIQLGYRIQSGDKEALTILIEHNTRLVLHEAYKYARKWNVEEQVDDFIQCGNNGLLLAAQKYDPTRNLAFSTHATFWIQREMRRYAKTAIHPTQTVSLNQTCYEDNEEELSESIEDPCNDMERAEQRMLIESLLVELPPRYQEVIQRYYGLAPYEKPQTLEEIGRTLYRSRERIRQIHEKAIEYMRNIAMGRKTRYKEKMS